MGTVNAEAETHLAVVKGSSVSDIRSKPPVPLMSPAKVVDALLPPARMGFSNEEAPSSDSNTRQLFRKRLRFFVSAIDQDKAFAILERALPGNCMACPAAGADKHHPQIAHIDREFTADGPQESFAVSI